MLRNRLHTFYDREGLHPILAPPYHAPAFRSLERGLRLKSCKYCFVVQIFNYDLSVLWLAPLSHRCYFLLFRETGRHNLTGDPNNTLWVMSPAVLENPKCTESDGRTCSLGIPTAISWQSIKFSHLRARYVSINPHAY